jgi:hypothetical protein
MDNPRLWYSIKSIDLLFGSISDFKFLKELQIKMPKLTTIACIYPYYSQKVEDFFVIKKKLF